MQIQKIDDIFYFSPRFWKTYTNVGKEIILFICVFFPKWYFNEKCGNKVSLCVSSNCQIFCKRSDFSRKVRLNRFNGYTKICLDKTGDNFRLLLEENRVPCPPPPLADSNDKISSQNNSKQIVIKKHRWLMLFTFISITVTKDMYEWIENSHLVNKATFLPHPAQTVHFIIHQRT